MSPRSEAHCPVMRREVLEYFLDTPVQTFIDSTLGDGGHAEAILSKLPESFVFGIDRDPEAVEFANKRLIEYKDRVQIIRGRFGKLEEIAREENFPPVGGILFDLGLRSEQINNPGRGFSFSRDGKLDMRIDNSENRSALEIVNETPRGELTRIIATYGEQPGAGRIARAIDIKRREKPIESTLELAEIVRSAIYGATAADLARVFQAIRIVVNDELGELQRGLVGALSVVMPGGIIVVISYHSLEDRIVKNFFKSEEKGCICPPDLPVCRCGHRPRLKRLTRKPVIPTEKECAENPKARSAKLRAARKLD